MRKSFLIFLVTGLFAFAAFGQQNLEKNLRGFTPPDELMSMSANIPFSKAIDLINKISMKKTGKKVISLVKRDDPIGVEIINIQYEKALMMIVQYAGLQYEKTEDATIVKSKIDLKTDIKPETYADVETREVRISAIFFEINVNNVKERGINWQMLLSNKNGSFGTGVATTSSSGQVENGAASANKSADFTLSGSTDFGAGGFFGHAMSLFRYFETQTLGEIIASPSVIVRNRTKGKIQVGSDFSFKQRDFSGNIIESFFSTGSIIDVTPYIYEQDNVEYVLLDLDVQRSSGFPSELSTEVRKSSAKTQILMLDGEETVIGGLYLNEDTKVRTGIPFLKDLPWWVLGIRYLTGSDQVTVVKKELVIVIKIEMLPKLKDRLAFPSNNKTIENEIKTKRDEIKLRQFDIQDPPPPEPKKEK